MASLRSPRRLRRNTMRSLHCGKRQILVALGGTRRRTREARSARPARTRLHAIAFVAALGLCSSAAACRYNIRELGFVDEQHPRFELSVFVHGDEQKVWIPEFQSAARSIFRASNVAWTVVDEVQNPSAPELRFRAQLGPRLPGAMLHLAGRDDGWPLHLHATGDELATRLKSLVASPGRAQLIAAVIDTYGAVLVLRGAAAPANGAAVDAARAAIKSIETTLAELPKRISQGPRLIEIDPSLPDEQVIAWALGVDGRDLAQPIAAVVYGRGRLAGPPLRGATLSQQNLETQLSIIGADCECTMDHGWMTAGSIPIAFSPADEARLPAALGFDPADAAVRAEVSQILAAQARIAADPTAPRATGYRETPLEIVTIAPETPVAHTARHSVTFTSSKPSALYVAGVAGFLLAVLGVCLIAWRKRK